MKEGISKEETAFYDLVGALERAGWQVGPETRDLNDQRMDAEISHKSLREDLMPVMLEATALSRRAGLSRVQQTLVNLRKSGTPSGVLGVVVNVGGKDRNIATGDLQWGLFHRDLLADGPRTFSAPVSELAYMMMRPLTFRAARPQVWIRLVSERRKPSLSASKIPTSDTSGRS
ncbi:MAG: hypothetical protein IH996_09095, partial [Proteobacteria bacterium]|nr:hypothetical protein [Pseudomonadota bacterium]